MTLTREEQDALDEVRMRVRQQNSEAHERLMLSILNRAIADRAVIEHKPTPKKG